MRFIQLLDKFLDELEFAKGKNTLIFVIMDGSPRCIEDKIEAKDFIIHKVNESSNGGYLSKLETLKEDWMFTDENAIYLFYGVNEKSGAIKYLNSQRDLLANIKRPIVIIGNEVEIKGISEIAPDFWRFRSRTHDLRDEPMYEASILVTDMIGNEDKIKKKIEENGFLIDKITNNFHLSELCKNQSIFYRMLDEEEKSEDFFKKFFEMYLFSIDIGLENDLKNGIISESLKKRFKIKGFSVSDNITIIKERKDEWGITDGENFIIRKEDKKLNVYLRRDNKGASEICRMIGDVYLLKGKMNKAINYYLDSLDYLENVEGLNNLGVAYYKLEKYEEAKVQFDRLIELFTYIPYVYYSRGLTNFNIGRCAEASRDFEKALELEDKVGIKKKITLEVKREKIKLKEEKEVGVKEVTELIGKAINPVIFQYLDLSEIYAFFKVKRYFDAKRKLGESSIRAYAVFGFHDILVKHYENRGKLDIDYLKIRLPFSDDEMPNFGAMQIGETIKFRGIAIYGKDNGSLKLEDDYIIDLLQSSIESVRKKIATFMSKKKIERHLIDELTEKKILIEVDEGLEYSDVKKEEKEEGVFEALVFLKVSTPAAVIADKIQYFNKNALNILMKIKEIRTIEHIISNSGDYSDYDYILHLVIKNLEQLREIIFERIHKLLTKKEMEVSTKVILPAEMISEGKDDALFETAIPEYARQSALIEILSLLKSEFSEPFLIKKLDKDDIEEIIGFYESIKRRGYQKTLATPFIYGIASALLKIEKEESIAEGLFQDCTRLFLTIFADFERYISENWNKWVDRASKVISEMDLKVLINALYKKSNRDLKVKDLKKIAMGQRVQIIRMWNSNFFNDESVNKFRKFVEGKLESDEKEKILNLIGKLERLKPEERTIMFYKKDLLREFQRNNGPEIRNWFAHFGSYVGDFKLESKNDIRKMLKVAKICLDFLD